MAIRDRIKELKRIRAGDLIPSPRNWRVHPQNQVEAMQAVLEEVGIADAVLVRETPEGYELIDGHLRAELDPDVEMPCLVLDVDEIDADKILATHDPLTGLAEVDEEKLAKLLESLDVQGDAITKMLGDFRDENLGPSLPNDKYTGKIVAPVYEPKSEKPPIAAMINRDKTEELIADIEAADLSDEEKEFLRLAAERHTVFNFRQIAEFYCHAEATLQDLMEQSGLVIIDFDKAIEYGFVNLTERLNKITDVEASDGLA